MASDCASSTRAVFIFLLICIYASKVQMSTPTTTGFIFNSTFSNTSSAENSTSSIRTSQSSDPTATSTSSSTSRSTETDPVNPTLPTTITTTKIPNSTINFTSIYPQTTTTSLDAVNNLKIPTKLSEHSFYAMCGTQYEDCFCNYTKEEMLQMLLANNTFATNEPPANRSMFSTPKTSKQDDQPLKDDQKISKVVLGVLGTLLGLCLVLVIVLIVFVRCRHYKEKKEFEERIDKPESISMSVSQATKSLIPDSAMEGKRNTKELDKMRESKKITSSLESFDIHFDSSQTDDDDDDAQKEKGIIHKLRDIRMASKNPWPEDEEQVKSKIDGNNGKQKTLQECNSEKEKSPESQYVSTAFYVTKTD